MTAAIYVRVSTEDQHTDLQLSELRAYVQRMGWSAVEYGEKASSVKRRPVLEQMMADARLRKFDAVLVWKIDRFARSLVQLTSNIQLLDSCGVRFIAVTQGIDTDKQNPAGVLMMHVLGAVAQFERSIIRERVLAGVAQAKRDGKHCGRPVKVWRRDQALRMRKAGLSWREVARKLGVPAATVRRGVASLSKVS